MDAQLEEDLVAMGIASPVTKATAGALYQQELSRQARTGAVYMRCRAHVSASYDGTHEGATLADGMNPGPKKSSLREDMLLALQHMCTAYTAAKCSDRVFVGLSVALFKTVHSFRDLPAQLADFLRPVMERAGGMMPLPDVYCLFNRARGTELVSPDDLLAAAQANPSCKC